MAALHSWWTVLMLAVFVGIVVWAWSGRRKADFDRAARIPLEDGDDPVTETSKETRSG